MITYKKSGVNIDKANNLVSWLKKTSPNIGGFSGLYPIGPKTLLSASCDGVGTKLKVANIIKKHDTIGIDLVAMNVNDLVCCGAKPLFFLDYYACGNLNLKIAKNVIAGIKRGCDEAGCVLLGGETAEMPGFYKGEEYDLAGFAVGVVDREKVIDGSKIKQGDLIIGLPSSGLHSNGFSLVRKIFSEGEIKKYGVELLNPTRIYVKDILSLLITHHSSLSGISHITGGGFYDNIERILPENCRAIIHKNNWTVPEIFKIVQTKGKIPDKEMYRTFNMGIGMILIVRSPKSEAQSPTFKFQNLLKDSIIIGEIVKGRKGVEIL